MKRSPRIFVSRQIRGVAIEPWQLAVLDDIGRGATRITIRSGHGVGKTALLAWILLWFLCTHHPCKVGCLAPTAHQLEDVLWAELALWLGRLNPYFRRHLRLTRLGLEWVRNPKAAFAAGRTARPEQPEALQGLHSPNALVLVDEASGVDDRVYDVMLGALSTPGAMAILAGNPTRGTGFFHDTHGRLADRWTTHHVSSEDVPRARGHIEDILARHGRDSNAWRVRVAGEFPLADDTGVIARQWCEAAMARGRGGGLAASITATTAKAEIVWGLDVARFGDDRSALAKRCGNVLLEPVTAWRGLDTMETAGLVLAEWYRTPQRERPRRILIDSVGIGAGVLDRLREHDMPVTGVNAGETPMQPELYARVRDELWFRGRAWLQTKDAVLPDDAALVAELTAARYAYTSGAKIEVESKDEMKRRGMGSPDLADAFLLTFAAGPYREERRDMRDMGKKNRRPRAGVAPRRGSWMAN